MPASRLHFALVRCLLLAPLLVSELAAQDAVGFARVADPLAPGSYDLADPSRVFFPASAALASEDSGGRNADYDAASNDGLDRLFGPPGGNPYPGAAPVGFLEPAESYNHATLNAGVGAWMPTTGPLSDLVNTGVDLRLLGTLPLTELSDSGAQTRTQLVAIGAAVFTTAHGDKRVQLSEPAARTLNIETLNGYSFQLGPAIRTIYRLGKPHKVLSTLVGYQFLVGNYYANLTQATTDPTRRQYVVTPGHPNESALVWGGELVMRSSIRVHDHFEIGSYVSYGWLRTRAITGDLGNNTYWVVGLASNLRF